MKAVVLTPTEVTHEPGSQAILTVDLEPTLTEGRSVHYQAARGTKYLWALDETTDHDRPAVRFACFTTSHDKDRKAFYATLRQVTRSARPLGDPRGDAATIADIMAGTYGMESTMLFDSVTVITEHVDRYSAKRMAEFDTKALAALRFAFRDEDGLVVKNPEARAKLFDLFDDTLIETKVTARVVESTLDESSLDFLQRCVGGDVEPVTMPDPFEAYINEDGKGLGLLPNPVATKLWLDGCAQAELLPMAGDYLAGPVVFTAGIDDEGDTCYLDDEQIALLGDLLPDDVAWESPVAA